MSEISTRDVFGEKLVQLGEVVPKLVVVSCDLASATRTKQFGRAYPERFFEVGIAEQNALGVAAGLALEGYRPIVSSFGSFIASRYDQIKTSCAYNGAGVVIVGSHSGLAIGKDGATQMGIEDINLMSGVPSMQIFQAADGRETSQIVEYLVKSEELAYLRISRTPHADVFDDRYMFEFNRGHVLREGNDAAIFASGDTVITSVRAAHVLAKEGLNVSVVSFSTLKPIDRDLITRMARRLPIIITVEDHNIVGGLGSRVCEVVAEEGLPTKIVRHGIPDCFGESGSPDDLYRKFGLDEIGIKEKVKEGIKRLSTKRSDGSWVGSDSVEIIGNRNVY